MKAKINKLTIRIIQTSPLSVSSQAVVNPTNTTLDISPELQAAAGQDVLDAVFLIGWCDIGDAVVTTAGKLGAKILIHTVSPMWGEASARGKLANATWEVLGLAEEHTCRSIAIPPITASVTGYPIENCAHVMIRQIIDFSFEKLTSLREVIICLASLHQVEVFTAELQRQIDELGDDESDAHITVS